MKLVRGGAVSALALGLVLASSGMTNPVRAQVVDPATTPSQNDALRTTPPEPTLSMRVAERVQAMGKSDAHADDVAAVKAYYVANPDKTLWIEGAAFSRNAQAALGEIGKADDWGLKAANFAVPSITSTDAASLADVEISLSLAVLKYARHARGGRIDPTQLTDAIDRSANLLSPAQVLAGIATAQSTDDYLRKLHPQHPQFERLRQLYLSLRAGTIEPTPAVAVAEAPPEETKGRKGKKKKKVVAPATPPALTAERVLFNMEQWRWMPEDLGRLYVKVNVPEFQLRIMKDDKQIHVERVVAGTVANQTPIFSKDMETIVFQPGWGVPPSIKVKELLPGLLAGRDPVGGRGWRMSYRGREVSASSINWRAVDIRKVSIVQPPGPSNALGMVKFLFPNKHDVYLHDTPSKSLFNADVRAFSHGCVRVRNPMRFAEVIFAETGGWAPAKVASLARGKPENQVPVPGKIGVHITYFTVTVDDDGTVHRYRDIYGHEARLHGALDGRLSQVARKPKDLSAIRTSLIGRTSARRVATADGDNRQVRSRGGQRQVYRSSGGSFFSLFGN
jgi:murein L,D-transpeptidase YcbB/YkuD